MTDTPVTKADKELYCEISGHPKDSEITEQVMAGTAYTWEVQQIANHRAQSEPSGETSQDELREAARDAASWLRKPSVTEYGRLMAAGIANRIDAILAKQERGV